MAKFFFMRTKRGHPQKLEDALFFVVSDGGTEAVAALVGAVLGVSRLRLNRAFRSLMRLRVGAGEAVT